MKGLAWDPQAKVERCCFTWFLKWGDGPFLGAFSAVEWAKELEPTAYIEQQVVVAVIG